jgi:hypothetical protein
MSSSAVMLLIYVAVLAIVVVVVVRVATRRSRRRENLPVSPPPPWPMQPPYTVQPGMDYGSHPMGPGDSTAPPSGQTAIADQTTEAPAFCGSCGNPLRQPTSFCTRCGTPV